MVLEVRPSGQLSGHLARTAYRAAGT